MRISNRIALLTLLAVPALLSGCFNYYEEIAFDENGQGELNYIFKRGKQDILGKRVAEYKWDNPVEDEAKLKSGKPQGLTLDKFTRTEQKDGSVEFNGFLKFEHLDRFAAWKGHPAIEQIFGGISLRKVDDQWVFERKIVPTDKEQIARAQKEAAKSKLILKVSGPGRLIDHNADRVENALTCVWERSLGELLAGPKGEGLVLKARFSIAKPSTPTPYLAIASLLVLAIVVGLAVLRQRRRTWA